MTLEPLAYTYEGEYLCVPCGEALPEDAEWQPVFGYHWSEMATANPHGELCSDCEAVLIEGWCEAVDTGNAGNGFCGDCDLSGRVSLEDQYENQ